MLGQGSKQSDIGTVITTEQFVKLYQQSADEKAKFQEVNNVQKREFQL